jgi:uncharacterized repeat protein (TIGR03803 family)
MRKLPMRRTLLALSLLLGLVALNTPLTHAQASAPIFTVLHNFAGPPDGGVPYASMVYAGGNLYGTTYVGGTGACTIQGFATGCGTVFKVALNNNNKEIVLHSFKGQPDGESPIGGLVRDAAGNLYGTTVGGGTYNFGTVFKLARGKETILYNFKGEPDGAYPGEPLLQDASGNFYGITGNGGAKGYGGAVFKLDANGNETVLYSFCSIDPSGICLDGEFPTGGLIMDAKGNLYGTTSAAAIQT